MKKIVFVLLFFTVLFGKAFAQEDEFVEVDIVTSIPSDLKTNEIYFSAGSASYVGVFSGLFAAVATSIVTATSEDKNDDSEYDPSFSFALGYNHYFWDHLGVGGFVNYENTLGLNFLTFQAKITGQYGFEHFKFYHALSGGILCVPGAEGIAPVFDVTLLGLKADFERFSIFIETCAPTTAILKLGASFKF